jgi:8-oxo-dGTP pyrophosphatase MutT (NUDIX family)
MPAFVRVFIRNAQRQVLVVTHKNTRGTLNFPGGKVETGESPMTAARREVMEETGLMLKSIQLAHEETFRLNNETWLGYFFEAIPLEQEAYNMEPTKLSNVAFVDERLLTKRGHKTFLLSVLEQLKAGDDEIVLCPKELNLPFPSQVFLKNSG